MDLECHPPNMNRLYFGPSQPASHQQLYNPRSHQACALGNMSLKVQKAETARTYAYDATVCTHTGLHPSSSRFLRIISLSTHIQQEKATVPDIYRVTLHAHKETCTLLLFHLLRILPGYRHKQKKKKAVPDGYHASLHTKRAPHSSPSLLPSN